MAKFLYALMVALVVLPVTADASHRDRGGWNIDRDDLDDEIVESLPIPVLFGITFEEINPDFGDPRGGGTRQHEGEDFIAVQGAPIVSPTEAIVIRTGTGASAGKYVYTANPGGETFRYMHLDTIADIERGDELDVGDFIGTVGDTGNAPDGVYHLHFETRDEDNQAQDPYPRLTGEFTLEEKMEFVEGILRDDNLDEDDYAEFLVASYPGAFRDAVVAGYELPDAISDILDESGETEKLDERADLTAVLKKIPAAVTPGLTIGDQGPRSVLLQLYLIYLTDGAARDNLAAAGPTGYYGSITAAAVRAYQVEHDLDATGVYDAETQAHMLQNDAVTLNL